MKTSEYQIGLSKEKEAVISAHFMHRINQASNLHMYSKNEFNNKAWVLGSHLFIEKLMPIIINKSEEFILNRIAAAEIRLTKDYQRRGLNNTKEELLASTIVELLCDRQFLKSPKTHISRPILLEQIKKAIVKKHPIKMVIPALPFKVFSPLKTRGIMPDIGELNFLLSLVEIAKSIDLAYKKYFPDLTDCIMASFTIICDGKRFNSFLNVTNQQIETYIQSLAQWTQEFYLDQYIKLVDYKKAILETLPYKLAEQKKIIRDEVNKAYNNSILPILNPNHLLDSIKQAIALDPDPEKSNPEGRFISLFKSIIYTLNYKKLTDYTQQQKTDSVKLYAELTRHLFIPYIQLNKKQYQKIEVNFNNKTWIKQQPSITLLEYLRQEMLKEAWHASIHYLAEIRSDRDLSQDPVRTCFDEYIRWTIHAKSGQLALLTTTAFGDPVQPWHGSGVFMKTKKNKIKMYTLPVLALEGEHAIPVLLEANKKQALFYIHPNIGCKNLNDFFELLTKQLTRQRKK